LAVLSEIANDRDWRLFQELGAQADLLLSTGHYVRELNLGRARADLPVNAAAAFHDLRDWRQAQGLTAQPALAILRASLDLPKPAMERLIKRHDRVYVATGIDADPAKRRAIEALVATVMRIAGDGGERTRASARSPDRIAYICVATCPSVGTTCTPSPILRCQPASDSRLS
jgi:hypothetical protein